MVNVETFFFEPPSIEGNLMIYEFPIPSFMFRGKVAVELGARGRVIVVDTHRLVVEPFYFS